MNPFRWVIGTPLSLPGHLVERYPELVTAQWRRGGIALRIGGWCIGRATVSGITCWRTIFLSHRAPLDPELLLHELRHVHQFEADPLFPVRYLWRSVKHGYTDNPYEADARAYAARRLAGAHPTA
ncbi:MAG: hypothetical protein ABI664_19375 [bacterium]